MDVAALPLEVGEVAAAGRALDREAADGAGRDLVAVVVDDPRLVAGDDPAGGAGADVVARGADEDVEHLGGADAVDDLEAGRLLPRSKVGWGRVSPAETHFLRLERSKPFARPDMAR